MKIFSPILKGTTTVAQGTTNLSGSFTGSLLGTAATASYADNFTVGGTLTAQTINVQIITSSIEFNTGSTRNGALSTNTHQFTGSVLMSGSLTVGSSITATSTIVTGSGEDGSSGPVMRLNSTHPNAGSRNWAIINTWDNFGDLTFRVSNNKDGNAITSGSTRMVILSSGNVGIGTTNAVSTLTVNRPSSGNAATFVAGTSNLINEFCGISLSANVQGADIWYASEIRSINTNSTPDTLNPRLGFFTQNIGTYLPAGRTEKMSILGNGNVGIGTISPAVRLQIDGTNNQERLRLNNTDSVSYLAFSEQNITMWRPNDSGAAFVLQTQANSGTWTGGGGGIEFRPLNTLRMTIGPTGNIGAPNGTNIFNASDIRLKQNVSPTTYGLNAISLLNPVKFNWVNGFEPSEDGKDMLGFVAQEVLEVIPEAVESFGGDINLNGEVIENPLRVNEKFIIPVLVKAIQELKSENDTLKEILQRNNIQ
jgi:hypothetical protein